MSYISKNEIDRFRYDDAVITEVQRRENCLVLETEALIVARNNSQNENYTDSYAGTAQILLQDFVPQDLVLEGYRYYDADGNLTMQVPDAAVAEATWEQTIKTFAGAYLTDLRKEEDAYCLNVEFADEEDGSMADSYEMRFTAGDITISWDRYMNRVGR